jgi:hypothetical protein
MEDAEAPAPGAAKGAKIRPPVRLSACPPDRV